MTEYTVITINGNTINSVAEIEEALMLLLKHQKYFNLVDFKVSVMLHDD